MNSSKMNNESIAEDLQAMEKASEEVINLLSELEADTPDMEPHNQSQDQNHSQPQSQSQKGDVELF